MATLRRHARALELWALGVAAVISGDFFGWNFGLAAGGFSGMLIATAIMTVMYAGLCFSIAEMSPALPHTGGAYSFARTALGPWGGYITGLAENMEYILTPATIVVGIRGYAGAILGTPKWFEPGWWVICYAVFVALNVFGVALSFRFSIFIAMASLAVLAVLWIGAIPKFDLARWALDVPSRGTIGVAAALPFALWLYLGIEQLPLAAEESHDPRRDMPKGIVSGLVTLIACSFLTVILTASIAPGAAKLGVSQEPAVLSLQTIFGTRSAKLLALAALTGLIASFHTIIFAYGRQIYSLSRAGYFPRWLSQTHPRHLTPVRSLVAGSVLGLAAAFGIYMSGPEGPVGAVLLNMAVFGAVIAYILQMASFIVQRIQLPSIERPYRSPLGVAGAAVAALIAAVTLAALFLNREYNRGVLGAAVWFLLGVAYFAFYARQRLVLSPEEEFAIAHRVRRADPEK